MHGADPDPPDLAELLAAHSGRLVFDIGANTGLTAALLADRFAHVVALEPCAESFAQLAALDAPNVTAQQLAVSARPGIVELAVQAHSIRTGQLTTPGICGGWGELLELRRVPATTVDALAAQHGDPDLLKVDVEGHELAVVAGAMGTLQLARPALFVEVHGAVLGEGIVAQLSEWYPNLRRVEHPNYRPGEWGSDNHYWLVASRGG